MTIPYDEAKVKAEQIIKSIEQNVYEAHLEILDRWHYESNGFGAIIGERCKMKNVVIYSQPG